MLLNDIIYANQEAVTTLQLCNEDEYENLVYTEAFELYKYTSRNNTVLGELVLEVADMVSDTSNVYEMRRLIAKNSGAKYLSLFVAAAISEFVIDVADIYEDLIEQKPSLDTIEYILGTLEEE